MGDALIGLPPSTVGLFTEGIPGISVPPTTDPPPATTGPPKPEALESPPPMIIADPPPPNAGVTVGAGAGRTGRLVRRPPGIPGIGGAPPCAAAAAAAAATATTPLLEKFNVIGVPELIISTSRFVALILTTSTTPSRAPAGSERYFIPSLVSFGCSTRYTFVVLPIV